MAGTQWQARLKGDARVVPAACAVGALFFLVVWAVQVVALGAGEIPSRAVLAGLLAFAGLWGSFGFLAASGLARLAVGAVVGHVMGVAALAVDLALARVQAMDTSFAVLALFGLTFLGILGATPWEALEWWRSRARPAA